MRDPHTLDDLAWCVLGSEQIPHVHSPQDEDVSLLLHLPTNLAGQVGGSDFDLARCQRAGKGARESACGRRNHVVYGCGVGLVRSRIDPVVFRDRSMDTEEHWLRFGWDRGASEWTPQAPNGTLRGVDNLRHGNPPTWMRWQLRS